MQHQPYRALVLSGSIVGDGFLFYVGKFLALALTKGDVVVLDNLAAHKIARVRDVTWPPVPPALPSAHSSDLDPLEQFFAELRALLGKATVCYQEEP